MAVFSACIQLWRAFIYCIWERNVSSSVACTRMISNLAASNAAWRASICRTTRIDNGYHFYGLWIFDRVCVFFFFVGGSIGGSIAGNSISACIVTESTYKIRKTRHHWMVKNLIQTNRFIRVPSTNCTNMCIWMWAGIELSIRLSWINSDCSWEHFNLRNINGFCV